MTGQPEGQGKRIQGKGEKAKQAQKADNTDRSVLRTIKSVRKAIHLVPAIWEMSMSRQVEELVRSGTWMTMIGTWKVIITAGIPMEILVGSGASQTTQTFLGSTALFQCVGQLCIMSVRKVALHLVKTFPEGQMSQPVG